MNFNKVKTCPMIADDPRNKIGSKRKFSEINIGSSTGSPLKKLKTLIDGKDTQDDENESSSDNEYEDAEHSFNPFFGMSSNMDDKVFIKNNHIYFRTEVDMDSVTKLTKLIDQYNSKISKVKETKGIKNVEPEPLYLHISSYGGLVHAGLLAVDYIKNSKIPIHTVVEGYACSMGSVMSSVGVKRYMTEYSTVLIHQIRGGMTGTFKEMQDDFENSKLMMNQIVEIYAKNCNGKMTRKQIRDALSHDYYWNFKDCEKRGLVDEIYKGE